MTKDLIGCILPADASTNLLSDRSSSLILVVLRQRRVFCAPSHISLALAALVASACGRFDFGVGGGGPCASAIDCDDGNPCTDDACVVDTCQHVDNTASCDDGDACTVGDQCTLGVCGAGAATGCPAQLRVIDRSVGVDDGSARVAGTGALAIVGTTATFATPLPDNIGVGDALEYDANGDGTLDALAFVHQRLSAQVYLVRDSAGATPAPTASATAKWSVFRAYLSLANAVDMGDGGTHNPNITVAAFDGYGAGRNLVANNEQWSFACYDDGAVDTVGVGICDTMYARSCSTGWTTDASHFLRIYTPTDPSEVGTSQRHRGIWGTGYQRSDGIIMLEGFVHLDGMSIKRTTTGIGRSYYVETEGSGGEVWISNSFGWSTLQGASKIYDIWDTGVAATGGTYTRYWLWNDIAYNETIGDARSGFYLNSNRADVHVESCTSYVAGGGAYYQSSTAHVTLTNCLGYSAANLAFAADDGFDSVTTSVSNDGSLDGTGSGNAWGQPTAFVDIASVNVHLDPTGANPAIRGHGTDLSASTIPFSTDIDGDARPPLGWDIGADQVPP